MADQIPKLLELAARCEAEGPSRALNIAIWKASGQIDEAHCAAWCRQDGRTDLTRARYISAWAPDFCRSLDAAVTLVPREFANEWGAGVLDEVRAPDDIQTRPYAHCGNTECWAKTPALALCAAALRARAHLAEPLPSEAS